MPSPPLTFLTVAVAPELPFARVLAHSVREHHPEARMLVVAADGPAPDELPAGTEALSAADLGLVTPSPHVAVLAPEWASLTAMMAALERELAEDGATVVVLAPDTVLLGRADALLGHDDALAVLGRDVDPPLDDGLHPDAKDLERIGSVDAGVVVLRGVDSARQVVRDWQDALASVPWALPAEGGLDGMILGLLERDSRAVARISSATTLAWWNLSGLDLARDADGTVTADGTAVELFRCPEFDVDLPTRLHPLLSRVRVSRDLVLRDLLAEIADQLRAAGAAGGRAPTVRLRDGRPLPPAMAALMASELAAGRLATVPSDDAGWQRFYSLLNEPAGWGRELGMTRYLEALWQSRDDLREVYPDVRGADGLGYVGWVWVFGRDLVPDELLPPRPPTVPADARTGGRWINVEGPDVGDPLWGVNVAGFFRSELGLGEAARLVISGLDAARVPALPVQGSFVPPCRQGTDFTFATPDEAPYPLNILCLNGDAIPAFAEEAGDDFFEGRHTIAMWWWEVGELPDAWQDAFRWVDEVWVATDHIKDLIEPSCPVPVTKVTLPVTDPPVSRVTRTDLGLPEDDFVFLYVYDYHSTEARKNPSGLVRAFKEAFGEGDGAHLVLKCINADTMFAHHDRVLLEAGDRTDITFVDRYLSVGEKNALIALSDCYVSPHRSEGFGLTPAEAMLVGTPVIATNYGGVLEFLDADNAFLVDYTTRAVGTHAEPYPPDATWADPDLGHLASQMRYVFEHRAEAAARAERGARQVRAGHGADAAGRSMATLLQTRYDALMDHGARSLRVRRTQPLDLSGPMHDVRAALRTAGERGGGVRGRADQVRQRVNRSVTARRDVIDAQILDEVAALDERVRALTAELDRHRMAAHTEVLAQFRRMTTELRGLAHERELRHHELSVRTDAISRSLDHHLAEHEVLPFMASEHAPSYLDDPVAGRVLGYEGGTGDLEPYRAFTDVFRGTEERVRELQQPYLPLLRAAAPVLDTGCGRGEMLDLLAEAGVEARGVDGDAGMVEHARRKGHDVVLGDVNEHLAGLPAGSLGAIVSLEVVEHMPADVLSAFLELSHRSLRAGGVLVAETVNPHALFALKGFWLDPTHHHPLFPEVLLTLARIAGFPSAYVFHPTGTGDVEHDRTRQPVYALVARR